MGLEDWPAVRAVYEAGIATGNANFETAVPGSSGVASLQAADPLRVSRSARKLGLG